MRNDHASNPTSMLGDPAPPAPETSPRPYRPFSSRTTGRIKILLVEDNVDDRFLVYDYLCDFGKDWFSLDTAPDFETGLEILRRNEHHVCLLDYRLGRPNGLELLRSAHEHGSHVPIILLTGQGNRDVDIEAMWAGAADYLDKSRLDPVILERSIRYTIERSKLLARLKRAELRLALSTGLSSQWTWEWERLSDDLTLPPQLEEEARQDPHFDGSLTYWMKRVPLDDIRRARVILGHHIERRTSYFEMDVRVKVSGDDYHRYVVRGSALYDAGGKVTGVTGVLLDADTQEPPKAKELLDSTVPVSKESPAPEPGSDAEWRFLSQLLIPDLASPLELLSDRLEKLRTTIEVEDDSEQDWLLTDLANQATCAEGLVRYLVAYLREGKLPEDGIPGRRRPPR